MLLGELHFLFWETGGVEVFICKKLIKAVSVGAEMRLAHVSHNDVDL